MKDKWVGTWESFAAEEECVGAAAGPLRGGRNSGASRGRCDPVGAFTAGKAWGVPAGVWMDVEAGSRVWCSGAALLFPALLMASTSLPQPANLKLFVYFQNLLSCSRKRYFSPEEERWKLSIRPKLSCCGLQFLYL